LRIPRSLPIRLIETTSKTRREDDDDDDSRSRKPPAREARSALIVAIVLDCIRRMRLASDAEEVAAFRDRNLPLLL
jgi:hypothetical protein